MKPWKTLVAIAFTFALSGVARAQEVVEAPDPARLALAEQVVQASGGVNQMDALLKSMFGAMEKNSTATATPEAREFVGPMFDDMRQEMSALAPQLLELSARVYARSFSEQELRDLLAFQTSDSGKAMIARMPTIQAEILSQTLPLIMSTLPAIMRKSADRICAEKHCTPAQRTALEKAMAKASGQAG